MKYITHSQALSDSAYLQMQPEPSKKKSVDTPVNVFAF